MFYKQEFGKYGEDVATDYLFNNGYSILCRNFSCKQGEIDIIALDHSPKEEEIVFVEVKSRFDTRCGNPADAVNLYKMKHIFKVAQYFLMINKLENIYARFDVIEVLGKDTNNLKINHIKNAIFDCNSK